MRIPELPDVQPAGSRAHGFVSEPGTPFGAAKDAGGRSSQSSNAALNEVLKAPRCKTSEPDAPASVGGTPQQMAEIVKADTQRWGDVIRAAM